MAERMNGRLGVSVTNLLNEPAHKIPPFCKSFFWGHTRIFLRVNCIVLALGNLPTPLFGEGPVLDQLKWRVVSLPQTQIIFPLPVVDTPPHEKITPLCPDPAAPSALLPTL